VDNQQKVQLPQDETFGKERKKLIIMLLKMRSSKNISIFKLLESACSIKSQKNHNLPKLLLQFSLDINISKVLLLIFLVIYLSLPWLVGLVLLTRAKSEVTNINIRSRRDNECLKSDFFFFFFSLTLMVWTRERSGN
jgi:hypothetical protein